MAGYAHYSACRGQYHLMLVAGLVEMEVILLTLQVTPLK